jgi:hypothetical protein
VLGFDICIQIVYKPLALRCRFVIANKVFRAIVNSFLYDVSLNLTKYASKAHCFYSIFREVLVGI